jgi:hypothetical protein
VASVFGIVLAACASSVELGSDAGSDALAIDGGVYRNRAAGYRLLHPACGVWDYDLDDPATYDTAEELVVAMADARCRWSLACDETDSSACDPIRVQSYVDMHHPVDVVIARTCLDALATAACDPMARTRAEDLCAPLMRGGAPEGSPCSADRFCRSGRCDGATDACGGTCGPPPVCPTDCPVDDCYHGTCLTQTFAGLGERCSIEGSFDPGPQCGEHLACDASATCVTRPRAGEPCLIVGTFFAMAYCDEGLVCDGTNCVAPVVVDDGHACDAFSICHDASDCFENVCTHRPLRGEPCRSDRFCTTGSRCNAAGTCAAVVGPGCGCDDGSACPLAFRCIGGSCQRVGIATQACTDARDCDGTACVDGHCFLRTLGRACSLSLPCDEGHCRPHGIGTCTATIPTGGGCFDDPYGCDDSEMCIDYTTFCALPTEAQNPCVPGYP